MTSQAAFRRAFPFAALGLAAGAFLLFATWRWGISMTTDSTTYLNTARNLAGGRGLTVTFEGTTGPLVAFPPIYTAVLAVGEITGAGVLQGARWINAILFAWFAVVLGRILYDTTGKSTAAAVAGACFVLASWNVVQAYGYLWSETLFLPLCFSSLWHGSQYARTGKASHFTLAVSAAAAGWMTRYAGVALVGALCVSIIWVGTRAPWRRVLDGLSAAALASMPLALWAFRNLRTGGMITNHNFGWTAPRASQAGDLGGMILSWAVPDVLPLWLRILLGASLLAAVCAALVLLHPRPWLRTRLQRAGADVDASPPAAWRLVPFERFAVVLGLMWIGTIVAVNVMSSREVELTGRIFLPLQICVLVVVIGLLARAIRASLAAPSSFARACIVFLLVVQAACVSAWGGWKFKNGIGFASRKWQDPQLMQIVRALPPKSVVYTNYPEAVYCVTGHEAAPLVPDDPAPAENGFRAPGRPDACARIREGLALHGGVIVLFTHLRSPMPLSPSDVETRFNPVTVTSTGLVTIYGFDASWGIAKSGSGSE